MSIFKIKKIIVVFILSLVFILPSVASASTYWFYVTFESINKNPMNVFQNYAIAYDTKEQCEAKRGSDIGLYVSKGLGNYQISKCATIDRFTKVLSYIPDSSGLHDSDLINFIDQNRPLDTISLLFKNQENWWLTVKFKNTGQIYTETTPFASEQACKDYYQKNTDHIIDRSEFIECKKSETKPLDQTSTQTAPPPKTELNYKLLAPLPGMGSEINLEPSGSKPGLGFAGYLNILINLFIGICAILAMIMIVMGGIQYMTSGLVSSKESAKETITNAILGLLLALGAFAILNTINPDLLTVDLSRMTTIAVKPGELPQGSGGSSITGSYGIDKTFNQTLTINGTKINSCDNSSEIIDTNLFGIPIKINKVIEQNIKTLNTEYTAGTIPGFAKIKAFFSGVRISSARPCEVIYQKPSNKEVASAHAFGLALDINGSNSSWGVKPCSTNMPKEFVDYMRSKGWGWGAAFADPMHYSLYPSEAAAGKISNGDCVPVGGTSNTTNNTTSEKVTSITYDITKKQFVFSGSFDTKNQYKYYVYKSGTATSILSSTFSAQNTSIAIKILSATDYNKIKNETKVDISVYNPKIQSIGKITGILIK
jgi:hypothetical protein